MAAKEVRFSTEARERGLISKMEKSIPTSLPFGCQGEARIWRATRQPTAWH
jgi:hypothetical protein